MWKSSPFVLVLALLLNDHLSSGNLMTCVKAIEQLPGEILEIPIYIISDIQRLFKYSICHLGYLTDLIVYITGWDFCDGSGKPTNSGNATTDSSGNPTTVCSGNPTIVSSVNPTAVSSVNPTTVSSVNPTTVSSGNPTTDSSVNPTTVSSVNPTTVSSVNPTTASSVNPTTDSSVNPTIVSSVNPTTDSSVNPTTVSSGNPTTVSSGNPTTDSSVNPTTVSSVNPTTVSSVNPTTVSSVNPTIVSSVNPTTDSSVNLTAVSHSELSVKPKDCYEVLKKNFQNVSGVYKIWPKNDVIGNKSIDVYCDMDTDGGGWTVLLRRGKYTPMENFNRKWTDYKLGFGDKQKEFWIGNDNMYALSNQGQYEVRFDISSANGDKAFAVYRTFRIENEEAQYRLHIENNTAGNMLVRSDTEDHSIGSHNNMKFFTFDKDDEQNCSVSYKSGWWYTDCFSVQLTSFYKPGIKSLRCFAWTSWKYECLAAADMKLRPT